MTEHHWPLWQKLSFVQLQCCHCYQPSVTQWQSKEWGKHDSGYFSHECKLPNHRATALSRRTGIAQAFSTFTNPLSNSYEPVKKRKNEKGKKMMAEVVAMAFLPRPNWKQFGIMISTVGSRGTGSANNRNLPTIVNRNSFGSLERMFYSFLMLATMETHLWLMTRS